MLDLNFTRKAAGICVSAPQKETTMELIHPRQADDPPPLYPDRIPEDITEDDERLFLSIVSTDLSSEQLRRVAEPPHTCPRQRHVLAVHWHPEFVPMEPILARYGGMFPDRELDLVIPTQHNELLTTGNGYYGVEVDCYSSGFDKKVQLLLHTTAERTARCDTLRAMLEYTFKYRSSQLFDIIETLVKPNEARIEAAARDTGADDDLINFVRIYTKKVRGLLDRHAAAIAPSMIKNKVLAHFINGLRPTYGNRIINRAQAFLKAVKTIVKAEFPMKHFYRTSEIIEEARGIGMGIVIPHPEQFWPIMLADYDVDGLEVWNPQSFAFTEFLISVVHSANSRPGLKRRTWIAWM